MFLLMTQTDVIKYVTISNSIIDERYLTGQGRSQTSEQDEASFERRRCEPLGWSGIRKTLG